MRETEPRGETLLGIDFENAIEAIQLAQILGAMILKGPSQPVKNTALNIHQQLLEQVSAVDSLDTPFEFRLAAQRRYNTRTIIIEAMRQHEEKFKNKDQLMEGRGF